MKLFTLLFLFFSPLAVLSQQLVVNVNNVAQNLADHITGPGVTITNPTLTCPTNASGLFSNGLAISLGIDSGVVLTTGNAPNITNTSSTFGLSTSNGAPGNTFITSAAPCSGGGLSHDACVLEFDITPTCDSVNLRFVFASDEYNVYVNSIFDVFAFLITGPNPAGGNYTNFNAALVPGTNTPIAINTINNGITNTGPCVNCSYFINNILAQGGQPVSFAYNGLTTVMDVIFLAVPGQNYHVRLGVQDCSDQILDTGVFLEAEGLSCPDTTLNVYVSESDICEGQTVTLTASGLTNYTWSPAQATTPGTGPVVVATPTATTTYVVTGTNIAGTSYTDSVTVTVHPVPEAGTILVAGTTPPGNKVLCEGDSATLVLLGSSSPNILWEFSSDLNSWDTLLAGGQGDTIVNLGPLNQTLAYRVVTVNGPCADTSAPATITIVPAPDPAVNDVSLCLGDSARLLASGGVSYTWTPPLYLSDANIPNPATSPPQNQQYVVSVENQWGCVGTDTANVTINQIPRSDVSTDPSLCPNNDGSITLSNAIGLSPVTFSVNGSGYSSTTTYDNLAPGAYTIHYLDAAGCRSDTTVFITELMDINASFTATPTHGFIPLTVTFTNTSTGNIANYHWDLGNGTSSTSASTTAEYENHGTYTVILTATASDERCRDTAMIVIDAQGQSEIAVPNVFTPNGDGMNDVFKFTGTHLQAFHVEIYDRWGRKVFESDDVNQGWDGTRMDGGPASEGTYFFSVRFVSREGIETLLHNTITLTR